MSEQAFRNTIDAGNQPLEVVVTGDMVSKIYMQFFSRHNYQCIIAALSNLGLGEPDWRSLTPTMRQVYRSNPGYQCVVGYLDDRAVRAHVDLLNRRVLQVVIPQMQVEVHAWDQYLKDISGTTLIDRPCMDGYRKRWTPVETDRQLY